MSTQQKMGTFIELGKDKAAKGEDRLCLSSAVPKIQWDSIPHCPYGYKAMGNLYLFYMSLPFFDRHFEMTCDFTSFLTVFQSYQDDESLIMKGCIQRNSVHS